MAKQDPVSMLEREHEQVRKLFGKLEKAAYGDSAWTKTLTELTQVLDQHTQVEEDIFYPSFRQAAEGSSDERLYYEAVEEHSLVDHVLQLLDDESGPQVDAARVKLLKELVLHHLEEEEETMFPLFRQLCDEDESKRVAKLMQERKTTIRQSGDGFKKVAQGRGNRDETPSVRAV